MPDIGHLSVGLLAGRWYAGEGAPKEKVWGSAAAFCGLSLLPDLDLVGRWLGYADGTALGHRGAFHSLFAAAAVGAAALLWRRGRERTALPAALVVASHGALDMLDTGALGVEYIWPLSSTHYFWPWRFLPGPPPGEHWLTLAGAKVVAVGALYFIPVFALALRPLSFRRSRQD